MRARPDIAILHLRLHLDFDCEQVFQLDLLTQFDPHVIIPNLASYCSIILQGGFILDSFIYVKMVTIIPFIECLNYTVKITLS